MKTTPTTEPTNKVQIIPQETIQEWKELERKLLSIDYLGLTKGSIRYSDYAIAKLIIDMEYEFLNDLILKDIEKVLPSDWGWIVYPGTSQISFLKKL